MNIHVFTSTLALKGSENAYTGWAIRRRKNILEEAHSSLHRHRVNGSPPTLSLHLSSLCVPCQVSLFLGARVGGGVELNNTTSKKRVIRPSILVTW